MKKILSFIYLSLGVFTTLFIFYNSMQNCDTSTKMSGGILEFVCSLLNITDQKAIDLTLFLVRKAAHMFEFALQSFFLGMFFLTKDKKDFHHFVYVLFLGLLTASTDEFIQLFPEGRSARVQDIWVDFSGTCAGLLVSILFNKIIQKFTKHERIKI